MLLVLLFGKAQDPNKETLAAISKSPTIRCALPNLDPCRKHGGGNRQP